MPPEMQPAQSNDLSMEVAGRLAYVLDLAVGQTDAVEVMRQLEVLKYDGKVLLISGRDEGTLNDIQQVGIGRGLAMLPSLRKPFRVSDLKERLEAAAAVKQATAEAKPAAQPVVDLGEALK